MSSSWSLPGSGLFASLLIFCGGAPDLALAEEPDYRAAWPSITAEELHARVDQLASERLAGRGTGEAGIRLAEEIIADAFAEAGLSPLPGHDDYFLPFTLYRRGFDLTATELVIASTSQSPTVGRAGVDFRPFDFSDTGEIEAEVVFAGYGITALDLDYDDYAGLDVAGKIVLVLRHEPRENDPASPFDGAGHSPHAFFTRKAENALAHGARGMLLVTDPLNHDSTDDFRMPGPLYLDPDEAAFVTEAAGESTATPFLAAQIDLALADAFLAPAAADLRSTQERIDQTMQPVRVDLHARQVRLRIEAEADVRSIEARNVAGYLEGSDPSLADQWIVVGGHHDHLGSFAGPGDTVYNGADDNGSGTAAVLALARAFAQRSPRPRRPIVFTTFTAEEKGLLGSRALVAQNQIDIDKVVFLLNIDMIGRNPDRPLDLTGDGFVRGMEAIVIAANAGLDVDLAFGGVSMVANTDHVAFFEREIPFLTFFTGLHEDYHQLGDHADLLDYRRMERIVRLAHGIVARVADREAPLPFLRDLQWLGIKVETEPARSGLVDARVVEVAPESRAARADIREGDIVSSIGGREVTDARHIGADFAEISPGTTTTIGLRRRADTRHGLEGGTAPDPNEGDPVGASTPDGSEGGAAEVSTRGEAGGAVSSELVVQVERAPTGYLGIAPAPVAEEVRRSLGLSESEGVLVGQVVDDGPAMRAGLEAGDVLIAINGRPVSLENLRRRLAQIGADEVVDIALLRAGGRRSLPVKLGARPRS